MERDPGRRRKKGGKRWGNWGGAAFIVLVFSVTALFASNGLPMLMQSAALLSAKLSLPIGGSALVSEQIKALSAVFLMHSASEGASSDSTLNSSSSPSDESSPVSSSNSSPYSGPYAVKSEKLSTQDGGPYESYLGITVERLTTQVSSANIAKQLSIRPDFTVDLSSAPQVLIIHTHTTEAYAREESDSYDPNADTRSTDPSVNVVKVGDKIAQTLAQNGIGVLHDTVAYDHPDLSGAYDRSLAAIEKDLSKYSSIKVVIDIHRDSITESDGTKIRPTAEINGEKAAQIQITAACGEPGSSLTVPNWINNYRFALRIQQQLVLDYPGLARPLLLKDVQLNEQVSSGALYIEIGSDVSTVGEAAYAGELLGHALSSVLLGLQG